MFCYLVNVQIQIVVHFKFIYFRSVTSSPTLSEDSVSFNTGAVSTGNEARVSHVSSRVDNVVPTIVEPVDYENYKNSFENDDSLMEFPDGSNDVDVYVLPRKMRTLISAGPEEDM